MTYRAMIDSQHKSPLKKRRMQSSSDAIQQEVKEKKEICVTVCMDGMDVHIIDMLVLFCFHIVYGPADSLHCSSHTHHTVCEVCQRNTEENGR